VEEAGRVIHRCISIVNLRVITIVPLHKSLLVSNLCLLARFYGVLVLCRREPDLIAWIIAKEVEYLIQMVFAQND